MAGDDDLNLKQVAARLGVHYMTAYRYVRQGRLAAVRVGTEWRVSPDAIVAFLDEAPVEIEAPRNVDWAERLIDPLLAGDETAAWALIERALAAGRPPEYCYLDMIAAAVARIDERREAGEQDAAGQPLATAVAYRLTARLGVRFKRPGRSRGSVVFGAPRGEMHSLPIAIVADVVRLQGFDVLELGADTPPDAFGAAAARATRLVAIGISVTNPDHLAAAREAIDAIRAVAPTTPIIVGGQAVGDDAAATHLGADAWAADARRAAETIAALAQPASFSVNTHLT